MRPIIKKTQQDDFTAGRRNRRYDFLVIALATVIVFLFKDKPEVLPPVLTALGVLVWRLGKDGK